MSEHEHLFEGTPVSDFQAKLPSITVDCDYYKSGTILRLAVEVRVKNIAYDEDREGNYLRQHKLAIQDIEVVSSYHPSDAQDQIAGSLAGGALDPDPDVDTGLDVGRTSDQWPKGVATPSNGEVKTDDGRTVDPDTGVISEPASEAETGEDDPESVSESVETEDRDLSDVGF